MNQRETLETCARKPQYSINKTDSTRISLNCYVLYIDMLVSCTIVSWSRLKYAKILIFMTV
jgi:hypothetical protein